MVSISSKRKKQQNSIRTSPINMCSCLGQVVQVMSFLGFGMFRSWYHLTAALTGTGRPGRPQSDRCSDRHEQRSRCISPAHSRARLSLPVVGHTQAKELQEPAIYTTLHTTLQTSTIYKQASQASQQTSKSRGIMF